MAKIKLVETSKLMTNLEIAALLRAVAAAYRLQDEAQNKFKIIAYERAADAVEHLSSEAKDLFDEGKLAEIPGVGEAIADHLSEIFRTGKSKHFEDLMKNISPAVFKLMELPRIGAKTAFKLVKELKLEHSVNPINDLEKKAKEGSIAALEGFGEESQRDIIRAIEESRRMVKRHLLPYALNLAQEIIAWLKAGQGVIRADALGSLRRMTSTVGDIDIAVATNSPQKVLQRFTDYPKSTRTIEQGSRTASILLPGNVQVDLMVQEPASYGSLLQHFTGSKHHNIALREYALKKGWSLSEYGLKQLKTKNEKLKIFASEEALYACLGMEYIPPELREDSGEIEAALKRQIPKLVQAEDVKGDLHLHSNFDTETSHDLGESSIEEIIKAANSLGYEYLALTDHNPSRSQHTEIQMIEILKKRQEKIEKINYSLSKKKNNRVKYLFNSLEIDILPDGQLSVGQQALDYLDFAVVSIHSSFRQSKKSMTDRVLQALSQPKVKILAHPTGRILNEREGVELDWPAIFAYCLKNAKWLEISADPMRLDLPDFLVQEAIKLGIKMTLGTDAHHALGLGNMLWGVSVARRGWCRKSDIINTLSLEEIKEVINK